MEFIIFAAFAAIALIIEVISAFSESFIFPAFAGMILAVLGLSLMSSGVDITYTAPFFNATTNATAVAIKVINYYDVFIINTVGIAMLLLGAVSMYGSYLRTKEED